MFLALMIATPGAMDAEGAAEVLPVLAEHPIIAATTAWLLVLLPLLLIVAGLSFFRALPAGTPGAFKLFLNLMSLKQTHAP